MKTIDPRVELFRHLALQLPGAVEGSHMGHPDFRLNNNIFATLSAQERGYGVLKLTPEQQQSFLADQPHAFSPVQEGWGRMGMTFIHLHQADESLTTAFHNLQKKQSEKKSRKKPIQSTSSRAPSRTRLK